MQTLDEKLTQVDAKLSLLLSVPKTDEKDKHETIKVGENANATSVRAKENGSRASNEG